MRQDSNYVETTRACGSLRSPFRAATRLIRILRRAYTSLTFVRDGMRGTGFELRQDGPGVRLPPVAVPGCDSPDSNPSSRIHVSHVRSRRYARDRIRTTRRRARFAARVFSTSNPDVAHSSLAVRRATECAGQDSNLRTPTGQRPKRCAVGRLATRAQTTLPASAQLTCRSGPTTPLWKRRGL